MKHNYHIIVVDDNTALLKTLKMVLGSRFEKVGVISNPQMLPAILGAGKVDLVLLDMNFDSKRLDGSDGLFWLNRIKEYDTAPAVILITAFGDIDLAVECMKKGADDFVTKPWDNNMLIEKIVIAIEKRNATLQKDSTAEKKIEPICTIEKEQITAAIKNTEGNITKAAKLLGISRRTLYNKIQKYEL